MCFGVNKVKNYLSLFVFFCLFSNITIAQDLSSLKITCSDLGFKRGTEKHGSCVITLLKKFRSDNSTKVSNDQNDLDDLKKQQLFNIRQKEYQLRQQALKVQQDLIKEQKRLRSLQYLGIATKGLEMIGPNNRNTSKSNDTKIYNFGCRTYGINTLCQGN